MFPGNQLIIMAVETSLDDYFLHSNSLEHSSSAGEKGVFCNHWHCLNDRFLNSTFLLYLSTKALYTSCLIYLLTHSDTNTFSASKCFISNIHASGATLCLVSSPRIIRYEDWSDRTTKPALPPEPQPPAVLFIL